jgi:hypothetical protein
MVSCMATKTITLEIDAYEKLRRAKRPGESFTLVVRRARFGPADASGASILATLDGLTARKADHEAAAYWERSRRSPGPSSESHWGEAEAS